MAPNRGFQARSAIEGRTHGKSRKSSTRYYSSETTEIDAKFNEATSSSLSCLSGVLHKGFGSQHHHATSAPVHHLLAAVMFGNEREIGIATLRKKPSTKDSRKQSMLLLEPLDPLSSMRGDHGQPVGDASSSTLLTEQSTESTLLTFCNEMGAFLSFS